ncbi:carcinoembryonic antigen-related cell adhesion molecule 3 [Pantherophis guttatus]|uniref:Carcinoembryonic antigen-related cell adhesion molecule 3 n=1 Tax=Pantherophis guttatus TaxID=94885 RepID=A0A6P9DDA0_PANGU|nr:carcinoembryonic antigen-related cell adhesion molecule 3 [Pantherophis guttatus]
MYNILRFPREPEASRRGCLERGWSFRQRKLWPTMVLAGYLLGSSCILGSQAGNTYIAVRIEPPRPLIGREVIFIPVGSMENISLCSWFRSRIQKENKIVTYQTSPILRVNYSNAYTGREQIQLDCSLSITNLTLGDAGFYVILIKGAAKNAYEKGEVLLEITDSSGKDLEAWNIILMGKETAGIVVGSLLGFLVFVGMFSYWKLHSTPRHAIETYAL